MNNREIKSLSEILTGLTTLELASRLNVKESFLEEIKQQANFSEWSKKQDPEEVSWHYDPANSRYLPNLNFSLV